MKEENIKIIQITAVPFPSTVNDGNGRSGVFNVFDITEFKVFGLGDDGIPYVWNKESAQWKIYKIQQ